MKAILVIDRMPNTCYECDYCGYAIVGEGEDEYKYRSCGLSQRYLGEIAEDSKDSLCPLKPLPKKILTLVQLQNGNIVNVQETSFANGWNACLEEITK